ncbi:MAG: alkaline phosphatase family protein [Planctomycetota bacterium]|nr:MAG: alkaline phosphatase family protein [Planctomycetota bacterium]
MTSVSQTRSSIPRVVVLLVPGLRACDLPLMPSLTRLISRGGDAFDFHPSLPALTCPVQAAISTGTLGSVHGIVANGVYDRGLQKLEMWTAPDTAIQSPRLWDHIKSARPEVRTAAWFLLESKGATADLVCMPAPVHNPDGSETPWCHSRPTPLYGPLREKLGDFPLHKFWGPLAGIESSQWIARSFIEASRTDPPHLSMVYLPHLDYASQRQGPDSQAALSACAELDGVIHLLTDEFDVMTDGMTTYLVIGEYQIVPVSHTIHPNRILRDAGLLHVTQGPNGELLDMPGSEAWALADHQVSHIFLRDPTDLRCHKKVVALFQGREGVAAVLEGSAIDRAGLRHARAGDVLVVSSSESWQSYFYWLDDALAPKFARTVDIHRKPGYDPLELFFDRAAGGIPLNPALVRGSHGAVSLDAPKPGLFLSSKPIAFQSAHSTSDGKQRIIRDIDVAGIISNLYEIPSPNNC